MTFKFAAPITTIATNFYRVELLTSVAASATFMRKSGTAGDWTIGLRTTTQQLPAAGDQVVIAGDYTGAGAANSYIVTMNSTTGVTLGTSVTGNTALEVSARGALDWEAASASNYPMTLNGDLVVNQDGAVSIGKLALPMPSDSTALLIMNVTTNVQYGILIRGNGSFTTYGASKTTKAYLASTANVGATSITTSVATGWASGDILAIASTSRLIAECEQVTMSGAASGTSVPISALTALHEGSALSNVAKAEIINLNRNVTIRGVSITLQSYFLATQAAQINCNFTEFQFLGSAATNQRGFEIQSTAGTATITGCSFRNFEVTLSFGIYSNSLTPSTLNVQNCVFYRIASTAFLSVASNTTTLTLNDSWAIGGSGMFSTAAYSIPSNIGTFTNLNAAGSTATGISFAGTLVQTSYTVNNIISHSNSGANISIGTSSDFTNTAAVFTNILSYRSLSEGLTFSTTQNVLMDTLYSFGNATRGLSYSLAFDVRLKNINVWSEASYVQTAGIVYANHADNLFIENGNIGVAGAHSTADINDVCPRNQHNLVIKNVTFGSPTLTAGQANYTPKTYTAFARLNGTAGNHRTVYKYGILTSDSTYFQTLSPSVRMAPNSATQKFRGPTKVAAVASGKSLKISVWVRKSVIGDGTTYNGNEVQLIVLSNAAAGISDDTVIATSTVASNGAFELITGTTAAVTDNVALEFLIACDGTLGWINVDRWSVEVV
jgi:hypothetical protein